MTRSARRFTWSRNESRCTYNPAFHHPSQLFCQFPDPSTRYCRAPAQPYIRDLSSNRSRDEYCSDIHGLDRSFENNPHRENVHDALECRTTGRPLNIVQDPLSAFPTIPGQVGRTDGETCLHRQLFMEHESSKMLGHFTRVVQLPVPDSL